MLCASEKRIYLLDAGRRVGVRFMGTLSRNAAGWDNVVRMHAWQQGPSGQMSVLVEAELERQSVHLQQLNAAADHLCWVQQQAHDRQVEAQYRLIHLQVQANRALAEHNRILLTVSAQLDAVGDLLRAIHETQLEHAQATKAECLLKEVLFQLIYMLDEMGNPNDEVARLALSHVALDKLDQQGLGTSHLSDLNDKRTFASFVKSTRQMVLKASDESKADLLAFETWHKCYMDAVGKGFPNFSTKHAPEWVPREQPRWVEMSEPTLALTGVPDAPAVVRPPAHNVPPPPPAADLPMIDSTGKPYLLISGAKVLNPDNGEEVSPCNVPSKARTEARFPDWGAVPNFTLPARPHNAGFWWSFKVLYDHGARWRDRCVAATAYEQALRDWALSIQRYDKYLANVQDWEQQCEHVSRINDKKREELPRRLAEFAKEQVERRASFDAECRVHAEEESQRKQAWENALALHQQEEERRHGQWLDQLTNLCTSVKAQGELINSFLYEHPDLQVLYTPVAYIADAENIARTAGASERQLALRRLAPTIEKIEKMLGKRKKA